MNEWMNGWMNEWMNGRINGCSITSLGNNGDIILTAIFYIHDILYYNKDLLKLFNYQSFSRYEYTVQIEGTSAYVKPC